MSPFRFQRLRTRILAFVVGLLAVVLGSFYLAVDSANLRNARLHIEETLNLSGTALIQSLEDREQRLFQNVRLLSGDFAFKTAFATGETETIVSALDNHRTRVGADVMMLVSFDDEIIANTLESGSAGADFPFSDLTEKASDHEFGEAVSIELIADMPYQLVIVPLFTPHPSAWIVIGFRIDHTFAGEIQSRTGTQVSLLRKIDARWSVFSSTLPETVREDLADQIDPEDRSGGGTTEMILAGEPHISLVRVLDTSSDSKHVALLQRSLPKALEPYLRLRTLIALISAAGLALGMSGVYAIARSVTRPVDTLTDAAQRIERGDYSEPVTIRQQDELGRLGDSFNSMMRGLAERRRVRNLLGKVVSNAIADQLLGSEIELGGEEREASILFADIRGFTTLCENRSPAEVLDLVNRYLTCMTSVIEFHQGVVDKYIGDAIMALFGAPLEMPNSAQAAVDAALGMQTAIGKLNAELRSEGQPEIRIGVGVNTGPVVAGNMGSESRLNYTVLGDTVNIASRVEGLTKLYGLVCVVTGATRDACPDTLFREIDRVRVKGKQQPATLYEPVVTLRNASPRQREIVERNQRAMQVYRSRNWDEAKALFDELRGETQDRLYEVFLERIESFRDEPPDESWDGVYRATHK